MLEKTNRFWKAGSFLFAMIILILSIMTGCSDETPEVSDIEITQQDREVYSSDENTSVDVQHIEKLLSDIYDEAVDTNTLGSLDIMRRMVARLGENGYAAVDSGNQIDMVQAEQAFDFCKAVDGKEIDELTIIVVMEMGIRKFDLKTEGGRVNIVREYYQYADNKIFNYACTVRYKG